jgi:hypothetical protein
VFGNNDQQATDEGSSLLSGSVDLMPTVNSDDIAAKLLTKYFTTRLHALATKLSKKTVVKRVMSSKSVAMREAVKQ